jgi:hypothetical protein
MLVDLGVLGQQVDQGALLFERVAANVIDQVVRILTASLITRLWVISMLRRRSESDLRSDALSALFGSRAFAHFDSVRDQHGFWR